MEMTKSDLSMKCKECNSKLVKKSSIFTIRKHKTIKLPKPLGYVCKNCGACYDEKGKKEKYMIGFLK